MRLLPELFAKPEPAAAHPKARTQRIVPVLDGVTGTTLAGLVQSLRTFEESARFGAMSAPQEGACLHLAREIETLPQTVNSDESRLGFYALTCPSIALHDGNAPIACDAATRRAGLLHQEVCLEFEASALDSESVARLARLKQCGFRLGLDVRRSGPIALDAALRVLIDTLRIDAREVFQHANYGAMLDAASATGVLVIAEHAHWRDGQRLREIGVRGLVKPGTDA